MNSDLEQLVKIRASKERRLKTSLNEAQNKLAAATRAVEQATQERDAYAAEIADLEVTLLRQLISTEIEPVDINAFYQTLEDAKRKAEKIAQNLSEAKQRAAESEQQCKTAAMKHTIALQAKERLSEIDQHQKQLQRREEARLQDLELDEFVPRGPMF